MSLSINKFNNKSVPTKFSSASPLSLLTNNGTKTAAAAANVTTPLICKRSLSQQQQKQQEHKQNPNIAKITLKELKESTSSSLLPPLRPSLQTSLNLNTDTLFSNLMEQPQTFELTQPAKATVAVAEETKESLVGTGVGGYKIYRTAMPSFKIMSYQNIVALLTVLVCGLVTVNGLKCYMCGQYNEGVGSITPCLNYSEQYAHLYLKECSKKSEKYCVKYVSELSIVRDCATECAEKEIWETQTYCCTEDGCNGSSTVKPSTVAIILPVAFYIVYEILNIIGQQRR